VALVRPLVAGQWPADAALHVAVLLTYTVLAWGWAAGTARRRFAG
jgi:lipooligosaccharide transport system permease protein